MRKKKNALGYTYLAPALISILLVTCLPIIYTVILSFTNYNMYHLTDYTFVGLENYLTVFSGSIKNVFFPVLGWTICFALLSTAGSYAMGLILAILLNNPHMKESKIYRAVLIVPWALPSTIAILAWQGLLNEQYGGINNLLHTIGIAWNVPWLTNPFWARVGLIIVNVWLGFPYMMNVCLGGLQAISGEYYEAAKMDGASKFQCFKSITLPMVTKLSIPLVISSFAANFNNFGNIYMITQGGPARVDNQFAGYTDILASTTYKMTTWSNRYELSATFSVLIFIIVGTFTLINMRLSGSFKEVDYMKNKKKISASEQRTLWGSRVVIWITMIVVLFPVIWIVMSSFSAGDSFFLSSLFPEKFSIEHYVELFRETDFGIWVFNSLKFCFIVAIIQLVLTSLAAYAFARLRFVGRKYGLMALLILQVFPNSMAVAGYYILIYKFGLVDNSFALILVLAGGSAYNIWLLKSYIDGLPVELDEAAMVDGANEFQVFYKIIIPLAMPQLAVIFLFSFIATYSEYVITSIFLQTPGKMTLALGLQSFISDQFAAHWTLFAAAAVISSLPIMIIFMCLQRFIQNGLVAGGVKG